MNPFKKIFTQKSLKQQTHDDVILKSELPMHPSVGLTPQRLAQILDSAEHGYLIDQARLFQDIEEKDGHIQAEMHKRKMAVVGIDWSLQLRHDATATEKKAAAKLEQRIKDSIDVEDMIFDALDAIGHGYSCLELDWDTQPDGFLMPHPKHRDPAWFTVNPRHPEHIRLRTQSGLYGDELQPFGWIAHYHKSHSGSIVRTGLHRALVWTYLFKNYAVKDLAELLDIYGLPIRVGKYGVRATTEEKRTLMQAVMGIGHNAGGIIPESMQMDFINASSSSSADMFTAMIEWCEATQSKAITGSTLSSMGSKGGSQALGTVHNDVRIDIRDSDAKQLANSLTKQFIAPLCYINGLFTEGREPVWMFDNREAQDLALYADALPKLATAGMEIPLSYISDKLKIPMPENNEPILQASAKAPASVGIGATSSKKFTKDQQAIESLADAMPMKSPIAAAAIQSAIQSATSPEDLEARLAIVLQDADISEFSQHLEKALFAADIMGYAHAK